MRSAAFRCSITGAQPKHLRACALWQRAGNSVCAVANSLPRACAVPHSGAATRAHNPSTRAHAHCGSGPEAAHAPYRTALPAHAQCHIQAQQHGRTTQAPRACALWQRAGAAHAPYPPTLPAHAQCRIQAQQHGRTTKAPPRMRTVAAARSSACAVSNSPARACAVPLRRPCSAAVSLRAVSKRDFFGRFSFHFLTQIPLFSPQKTPSRSFQCPALERNGGRLKAEAAAAAAAALGLRLRSGLLPPPPPSSNRCGSAASHPR